MINKRQLLQRIFHGHGGPLRQIRSNMRKDLKAIQSVVMCDDGGNIPERFTITTTAKDGTMAEHQEQTMEDWHRMEKRVDTLLDDSHVMLVRIRVIRKRRN